MVKTAKRALGDLGESASCEYLRRHGFSILERNYLRKWGEIDIIARKDGIIHFIEVKSVSRKTSLWGVTHGTGYRPEENVHPQKLKRLARALQTYILEQKLDDAPWQLDVMTALIDTEARQARVEMLENIVI
jgi:putative endonuclease